MRILIVQAGDYGEAWHRFRAGGEENYRDQRKSVDYVESLSAHHDVTVLARCGRVHDELLKSGLRSIGVTHEVFYARRSMRRILEPLAPDTMIMGMPCTHVIAWAASRAITLLPVFADMFQSGGIRTRYRNWKLGRALRRSNSPCVANHSLEAAKSLRVLRVPEDRIVPWEFVPLTADPEPKQRSTKERFLLLFVGIVSHAKGLGDCVEAVSILRERGIVTTLTVIGPGDIGPFERQVSRLALADVVSFGGRVSTTMVRAAMREHDAVIVPSRHEYPEGLPNTIFEALASRTPLIASDHPAFAPRLAPAKDSLQFRAGDPVGLADQVALLASDADLYRRLSENSEKALRSLYVGVDSEKLFEMFFDDPGNTKGWVERHSLARILDPARVRDSGSR